MGYLIESENGKEIEKIKKLDKFEIEDIEDLVENGDEVISPVSSDDMEGYNDNGN